MLASRVAVVTGAASGIGRACCLELAKAGASIVLLDRDVDKVKETLRDLRPTEESQIFSSLALDVAKHHEVESAFQVIKESGLSQPPSILVNSAGITKDQFLLKMDPKQWKQVLDVNLTGLFHVTQAFARNLIEMRASPELSGSITNISSIIGKTGNIGQCNYAASKAGVIGFTKSAAKELARDNIRVNAILPGFINTPMAQAVPEKVMHSVLRQIPLGRMGEPEDIASAALFLSSDSARYITGSTIEVTGGLYM